jgi:hypothetical protein
MKKNEKKLVTKRMNKLRGIAVTDRPEKEFLG